MKQSDYERIRAYMLDCMQDSAHDSQHIDRVLYSALEIAREEPGVNRDILIAACLLHDIGRKEQADNPALCYAAVGAEKAYAFLAQAGYSDGDAAKAAACIGTHRFRSENPPESIEAKILFDADKLDAAGVVGIARTLLYHGQVGEPLYSVDANGEALDGLGGEKPSFFQEYQKKLKGLYTGFYTKAGTRLALQRQQAAADFFEQMLLEVRAPREAGRRWLADSLE